MLAINRHHRIKRIIAAISAAALVILSVPALLYLRFPQRVEAGWFDDSWNYREQITFGNTGSADSNKKVLYQINTSTPITAGKMQSSCQDVRFTDANGAVLRYFINVGGGAGVGCNDSSSDFYVLMPTIVSGDNLLYVYYGNASVPAGTESANFSEATFTPTSGPTVGSEEKGPSPSAYWKFDEGIDRAANDSSTNQNTLRMNPLTGVEQQINILDQEFISGSQSYTPTDNSLGLVRWDGTKYSGETVYFEAVIQGTGGGSPTFFAALFNSAGTQVTGSEVSTSTADVWTRLRSSAITLTDGTDYSVRIKRGNGVDTYIKSARLIVIQSASAGISNTETQIEVGNVERLSTTTATQLTDKKIYQYDSSKFSPPPTAYFEATLRSANATIEQQVNIIDQQFTTTSTTYTPTDNSLGLIRWDGTKYSGETVYFEVVLRGDGAGSPTFFAALFDSAGTQVTGSEVSFSLTDVWSRLRSSAITLTDTTDYTVRIHRTNGANTYVRAARLIVVQTGDTSITDTETQVEVGNNETTAATTNTQLTNKKIYRFTSAEFSPAPTVYFEATLSNDTAGQTAFASLYTDGASCTTQVTSSEVSVVGTTWSRVRSAAITLTTGTDYMVCIKASANNARIANAKIIFDQTAGGGITDVELVHQEINSLRTDADSGYTEQDYDNRLSPDVGITGAGLAGGTFTYLYEATLKTSAGTGRAELWNDTDNLTITSSEVTTTSTSYVRVRSGDITANMPTSETIDNFKDLDSRIRNDASNTTSAASTWLIVQASNLATSDVTAYADLYNLTDAAAVSGSEVSTTSTSWTRARSSSITLTTAKDYVVRLRTGVNNADIHLGNAKVILDQTSGSVSAVEVIQEHINSLKTDADTTYTEQDFDNQFNPTNFSGGTFTYYFEATLKTSNAANSARAELWNDTDNLTITSSEVTTTSISYARVRSGDITANMPGSAKTMDTRLRNSSTSTTSSSTSWIVIQGTAITAGGGVASWQTEDACVYGKCLFFDGVDDVAISGITDSIDLDRHLAGAFTFQGWVRVNSDGEANVGEIFDKGITTYMRITNDGTDGLADLEASLDLATTDATLSVNNGITLNKWHHVALVYTDDGDDEITIYIDANNMGTSTLGDGAPVADANNLLVGGSSAANFHGFMDEFKIYKTERTAAEIKTDFVKGTSSLHGVQAAHGIRPDYNLSDGLVGYWKMDESSWTNNCSTDTVLDSSGNGNNGDSCPATTGPSGGAAGKFGKGGDFDGSDDYVSVPDNSDLSFSGDFTITAWVKLDRLGQTAGAPQVIARKKHTTSPFIEYELYQEYWAGAATEYFIFSWYNSSGTVFLSRHPAGGIATGKWYHLTAVKNSSNVRLYVNGDNSGAAQNDAVSGSYFDSNDVLTIGSNVGFNIPTDGQIDDVRIYNRAFTPLDVQKLYLTGPGPVAHWKLDDNTGTIAVDSSSNGNTTSAFTGNTTWATGRYGSALTFDGTDDVTRIVEASSTDLGATTDSYTVEGFINTTANYSGNASIISKNDATGAYPFDLYLNSSEFACFQISDGTNSPSTCGSTALNDGNWHHIAGKRDVGADTLYIFVDGVQINSTADTTTATAANNDDLSIGNAGASYIGADFNGKVDDVRLYNYPRTASQVIEDMNAGHPAPGSPIGSSTIYWKFDEQQGTLANNSGTDSALDGTATGTVWRLEDSTSGGCKLGGCVNIDTATDDVTLTDPAFFDSLTGMTASFWLNPQTLATTNAIVSKSNTSQETFLIQTDATNSDELRVYVASSLTDTANYYTTNNLDLTAAATYANWQQVAVVYDATAAAADRVKVYKNGRLATGTVTGNIPSAGLTASTANFQVGESHKATSALLTYIDEVKIYNFALTSDQVKVDATAGSSAAFGGVLGTHDNEGFGGNPPVGWWKMDENTGTSTVNDTSGNENSLTMNGMAGSDWITGKYGSALNFNSSTKYLSRADDADLDFSTSDSFSIASWFQNITPSGAGTVTFEEVDTGTIESATATITSVVTSTNSTAVTNHLYLAAVSTKSYRSVDSVTGLGLTWTPVTSQCGDRNQTNTAIFRALGSPSGDGTVTANLNGGVAYAGGAAIAVHRYSGINTSSPIGNTEVANTAGAGASAGACDATGTDTGTYSFATLDTSVTNSVVFVAAGQRSRTHTNGTNYVERADIRSGTGGDSAGVATQDQTFASITTNLTVDGTFSGIVDWGVVAIEIKAAVASTPVILAKYNVATGTDGGYKVLMESDGDITCGVDTDNSGFPLDSATTTAATYDDSTWHHVACVKDGSASLTLYIDGVAIVADTSLTASGSYANTDAFYLGIDGDGTSNPWGGKIDDVKVYRYALNPAQIAYVYNRGQALGYWKLDECSGATANDSGFGANNGTITIGAGGSNTSNGTCGGAAGQGWFDGKTGKRNASLEFDGSDDRVDMGNPTDLQLERTSPMTLEAWIKTTSDQATTIFAKQESSVNFRGYGLHTGTGGLIFFQLVNVYSSNTLEVRPTNDTNYYDGNWHHLVATYDGLSAGSGVTLYFDGKSVPTTISVNSLSATIATTTNFFLATRNNAERFFNGQIDEVKIYNYALTADQVKRAYNYGAQFFGPLEGSP